MNYYSEIKGKLIDNEINRKVKNYSINKSDLDTYYYVGKMLSEAGKHYGEGIIKNYSIKLMSEVDKKYSYRNLMSMRKFYLLFKTTKLNAVRSLLSWTHYRELLKLQNEDEISYYIGECVKHNLSTRQLEYRINNNEYKRLPIETKNKLISNEEPKVGDLVKSPIIIKNNKYEIVSEKILQKLILEDIPYFLEQLGPSFTFIKNEYKIKIGESYNYIDLLLFNIDFNCYVVIELKITELKKEHIGQIEVYMNYINKNLKRSNQDKTIGIIICKRDNKFVMEYSSDPRIISREFYLMS